MVKRMVRTAAAVLTMTSMFAMTAFASEPLMLDTNGGEVTAEGDAWMTEPVIEVELPGDLSFGINPLYLDADDNPETEDAQIISGEYLMTNYSDVPVLITAETKVVAGDNIELAATPAFDKASKELKTTAADKKGLWLFQLLPTGSKGSVTIGDEGTTLNVTDFDSSKDISSTGAVTQANLDKKGKTLGAAESTTLFMLKKYAVDENEVVKPECVSGFKFSGAVDPTKSFRAEDAKDAVKVQTKFSLKVLSAGEVANGYVTVTGFDPTVVKTK